MTPVTDSLAILKRENQVLREKEKQLTIINDFAIELIKKISIDDIVWFIAKNVAARMGFFDCVVYLYDESTNCLIQAAAHGPKNPIHFDIKDPIIIELGKGIVGCAAASGKPELVHDTRTDSRYIIDDDYRLSEISVPIIFEDQLIGVIDSEHPEVGFYTKEHLKILETVAALSSVKITNARHEIQLANHQKNLEEQVYLKTKELQDSIEKLSKSNQDLESFAYAASHDLQEPIRTIASYLQLIERKEKNLSQESKEFLNFAVDGSKRMRKLLEGLLSYSRLKRTAFENEVINLDDLLLVMTANLNKQILETNSTIQHKNLGTIYGNKTQISQLFQNIISNAIKFRKDGVAPIIKINRTTKEGKAVITIEDNGIGIDPNFHQKIFQLFSRLNTINKYSGSGIGLALCKRIVENHFGTIGIDSEKGQGTKFTISIPIEMDKMRNENLMVY